MPLRKVLSDYWYASQQELFPRLESELSPTEERYELFFANRVRSTWRRPRDHNRVRSRRPAMSCLRGHSLKWHANNASRELAETVPRISSNIVAYIPL